MVNKLGLCWFRINFAKLHVLSGVLSVLILNLSAMTHNIILFKLTAADMEVSYLLLLFAGDCRFRVEATQYSYGYIFLYPVI